MVMPTRSTTSKAGGNNNNKDKAGTHQTGKGPALNRREESFDGLIKILRHMRKGISVWLDVLLEALARRIIAVGTGSRPLLHHGDGDPYTKTIKRLSTRFEERGEAYANADVIVYLENMAAKFGYKDVIDISPTAIAIEALTQIEHFLTK